MATVNQSRTIKKKIVEEPLPTLAFLMGVPSQKMEFKFFIGMNRKVYYSVQQTEVTVGIMK
jgi:hypothetical protein